MNFVPDLILSLDCYEEFLRKNHIIYRSNSEYFIIMDDSNQIKQVEKMPPFLQQEYLHFKSEYLEDKHIDRLLTKLSTWCGFLNDETSVQNPTPEKYSEYIDYINLLKKIKLDLKIGKLFS
jgi:hypothetical protein